MNSVAYCMSLPRLIQPRCKVYVSVDIIPPLMESYQVDSWLGFASSFSSKHLASVDRHLHGRSFLAGNDFSLADIAIFFASASTVADAVAADATSARKTLDFSRW